MAQISVNGTELHYERQGSGPALAMVHGSWGDSFNWLFVAPMLAERFDVVTYDRRGHGQSTAPSGQGSRAQDEDDLLGLIDALGIAPVNAAGNSFGASTVLGAAARRPDAFARIAGHEPPLLRMVIDADAQHLVDEQHTGIGEVLTYLEAGRDAEGAEYFVENVALGPGAWEQLPEPVRDLFVKHAQTFLDEQRDPDWDALDLEALGCYPGRILLSQGGASLEWFSKVVDAVAARVPSVERTIIPDAGHVPQMTHPAALADVLTTFFLG